MKSHGVERIAIERKRQIERLGYDAVHDRKHRFGELLEHAQFYINPFGGSTPLGDVDWQDKIRTKRTEGGAQAIKHLVKAGALIAAAIDQIVDEETREYDLT